MTSHVPLSPLPLSNVSALVTWCENHPIDAIEVISEVVFNIRSFG